MKFTIHGIIRGGKNNINITRQGHRYPNAKWAIWRDQVVNDLRVVLTTLTWPIPLKAFQNPCKIELKYWAGDKRRRDVPAMIDALWSCFEKAGIVKDDCLFKTVNWIHMGYDKENPKVEVQIEEI